MLNTAEDIIEKFHTQVDDMDDLADDDALDLLNDVYIDMCIEKPYEMTKKAFTGTTSTSVPTVPLPSDFGYVVANHNHTEDTYEAHRPVVFVIINGSYVPYHVISFSDRRQYLNKDRYCYIDVVAGNLVFTNQPLNAYAIEFDYVFIPARLALGDTPIMPERFRKGIAYKMAVDNEIIQRSDKAKNCMADNQAKYQEVVDDLDYWNANLIQQ